MRLSMSDEGRVLIVGAMPRNLPEFSEHPKVILWGSDIQRRWSQVPSDVEVVLFTKFMSHSWHEKIKASCSENVFVNNQILGTGEVKKILLSLGIKPKRKEVKMAYPNPIGVNFVASQVSVGSTKGASPLRSEPSNTEATTDSTQLTPTRIKRGDLKDFVLRHGDPNCSVIAKEAKRLLEIANRNGVPTTFDSLEQAVRRHLKRGKVGGNSLVQTSEIAEPSDESFGAITTFLERLNGIGESAELAGVAFLEIRQRNEALEEELVVLRKENEDLKSRFDAQDARLAKLKELLNQ